MRGNHTLRVTCIGTLLAINSISAAEDSSDTLDHVHIISTTPVPATGLPENQVPNRVQSLDDQDIEKSHNLGLTDFLNNNLGSVNINAAQNNPLQPDLQFRGYTASPLLGLPIGIAVYQNGVRINEPLGDTVNWDLIPKDAIAGVQLISGANPLYGLNALGGALTLQMKNGFTHPGHIAEIVDGDFSRTTVSLQSGGNNGSFGYYVNFYRFEETGWRDFSNSDANNIYASLNFRTDNADISINAQHGDTDLRGNGPAPIQLLDEDYRGIFTAPDITENDMTMVNLVGSYWFNDDIQLSGNVYWRDNDTDSFNGDLADEDDPPPAPFDAINNISNRDQETRGTYLQATYFGSFADRENQFTAGTGYHRGQSDFNAQEQFAVLDPLTRSTTTSGALAGPFSDEVTDVSTRTESISVYATDTISLTDKLALTASARYDKIRIRLRDRSGDQPELDGNHSFGRVNPAIGATYQLNPEFNLYGSYSESSRAPTPIELSCSEEVLDLAADPDDAECRLPNAFLADPPLDQVVAKDFEVGMRGGIGQQWTWHLGAFHTKNKDDIIFQSTGRATGLFKNVDETRRIGVEAALGNRGKNYEWFVNYSYLKATFEDDFLVLSPNHPAAADLDGDGEAEELQVKSGDNIPGFPENTLKISASYDILNDLSIRAVWLVNDGQYLRGDESNQLSKTPGYGIVNLVASYQPHPQVEVFARVDNVFDKEYFTFGLLGEEPSNAPGLEDFEDPRFLGAGQERGAWVGLRVNFGTEDGA